MSRHLPEDFGRVGNLSLQKRNVVNRWIFQNGKVQEFQIIIMVYQIIIL